MEVKKITEGMTAPQVAQVIDDNFKAQNKILEEDIATQNSVIGVSEYKDFSEAEAVNVGDVRKYNGFLYECVEATTGAFDASKWMKSSFKAETEKIISELDSEVLENYNPIWVQGEFDYNKNPILLNKNSTRIKTVVKVNNLLSVKIENPEYVISTGFIFGKNKDLTVYKIVYDFDNIQDSIKKITSFDPCYLMFSIKKVAGGNINPKDSNEANVVFEYYKIIDYSLLNKGLVLNTTPYFEQGEFNVYDDPVTLNRVKSRIKTIFNIVNINTVSITNSDYEISAGFITNADMDLVKNKCYVLDTISEDRMSVDVKSALLKISTFSPSLLVLSFRKKNDIAADILPGEGSNLGLKFDVLPIQKEIDNLDKKLGNVITIVENRYETGFEQGEFNYNYDPAVLTNDPLRIRRTFDITDLAKITVGNPNAEMRYYILMQEDESLAKLDISYGDISSNEVNLTKLKETATFNATKILISFGYKDNKTPLKPSDAKDLIIEGESIKLQKQGAIEVVCWGDSLTAGDGVGEYPKELMDLLGEGYKVYNQGVGGETSHTILARLGSECIVSEEDFMLSGEKGVATLIADGTLNKYLKNATSNGDVTPLLQSTASRINPCYVNGIECTLYREYSGSPTNSAANKWYIKPNISIGHDLTIKANTPIICQASKNYRNKAVNIVWVGTNDGTSILSDIDLFIKRLKESDNFARPKCTIFINPHTIVSSELDNAMMKEFGNRFFNWRKYVSSIALYEFGITPTTPETLTATQKANGVLSDTECMAEGKLPSSLWRRAYRDADDLLNDTGAAENSKDSTHMNVKGYKILAKKISEIIHEHGI